MGKNSRQRRKARRRAEREVNEKQKLYKQILAEADSRLLPFQWIPKFSLAARTAMKPYYWTKLSKKLREKADYVCAYCGESYPEPWGTALHEEWKYTVEKIDDKLIGTYHLKSLKCVCKKCHNVCHPGAAGYFDGIDINDIIERYCKINKVNDEQAIEDFQITKARRDYLAREVDDWKLEDGILNKIENEYGIKCYSDTIQF